MFRQFLTDSAIYSAANILSRGVSLLLLPFYTRVLSPIDYGIVDILVVFANIVGVTIALEISQALARHYPDVKTETEKIAYASTALWFTVGVYTFFVAVCMVFSRPLTSLILESSDRVLIFQVTLLSIWANGIFYLMQGQLRWDLQAKAYSVASLASLVTTIGMSVLFVLIFDLGVLGVIGGQLVGRVVGIVLSYIYSYRYFRLIFDREKLSEMLKFSTPLVPSSMGVIVALYIDRVIIKELMSLTEVGIFGVGYRFASIIGLLMVGFSTALTPLIYTHYRQPSTPGEIARIFRYFVVLALLTFLGMSIFAKEILYIFTTPAYYAAAAVVPFLVLATCLSGMYIFAPGLGIVKKTGVVALISILSGVLVTVLNFILIPLWGIVGSAVATFLSAAVIFVLRMAYSQKHYFIPHDWKPLVLGTLTAAGMAVVGVQVPFQLWVGILVKLMLVVIVVFVFIWLGLVNTDDIRRAWTVFRRQWLAKTETLL